MPVVVPGPELWLLFGLGVAAGVLEFWLPLGLVPFWFSVLGLAPGGFELVTAVLWLELPDESVLPAGLALLPGAWGLWLGLLAEPFSGVLLPAGLETWVESLPPGVFAGWELFAGSGLAVEPGLGEVALPVECELLGELGLVAESGWLAELGLLVEVELAVEPGTGEFALPVESLGEFELFVEGGLPAGFGLPVELPSLVECEPLAELVASEGVGPLVEFWPLAEFGLVAELGPLVEGELLAERGLPLEAPSFVEFGLPGELGLPVEVALLCGVWWLPVELFGGTWLLPVELLAGG
ncbi:hypothetical protein ACFXPA_17950 [Amycolatopsis sp. NPDC059090]|uniref:hypothetical protein n=1 Tax=unclassified Amycolatopsis TaxID=2618356 RepID=UPI00366C81F8